MGLFSGKNKQNVEDRYHGLCVTSEDLIVQQKYLPYLALRPNKLTSNQAGDVKSAFKGRGMEFEEVRAYNFGDDIRDIDWRVTARKDEPYTKVFNEEKDREIIVLLDFSASMVFGTKNELKSVSAAKIAALIGWLAIRNKDRFGLLLFDGAEAVYYKPQNNMAHLMSVFNQISLKSREILNSAKIGDLSKALDLLQYHQKGRGTIFILSDFYNFNQEKFKKIAALSKRHQVYCLNIFDVLEEIAPEDGIYAAAYLNEKTVFDTSSNAFKTAYRQHFADNRSALQQNCQKFHCRYMEIRTDQPYIKQLSLI